MKNNKMTGFPGIDLPQSLNSSFFEKNPIIPSLDVVTILKLLSRKALDNKAIDCDELSATYNDLFNDYHVLSLGLRELGIKKKDIVTIPFPSNYQAICTFLALNDIGAVTTFVDTYSSMEDIVSYLNNYESPVLINFDKTREECEQIRKKTNVKNIITLSKNKTNSRDFNEDYKLNNSDFYLDFHTLGSLAKYQKNKIHLPNKGSDDALILYTSGSTGKSKAVVLTNKNIIAAQMYAGNTSHTENITGTKTMTCVPLRYPYGMVTSLLTSLLWGKEAIMTPNWDSDSVNYYYNKKPNIIFGSPAVLELSMRFLSNDMDLSQVSHFISGGDFLTEQHAKRGYDFFGKHNNKSVEIGNGCGNAETVSIGSTPVGVPLKQSTAGKLLVGSTAIIIDKDIPDDRPIENGNIIKEKKYNEVGELCISGEHVFKEYFGEPMATKCAKFIRNGKEFFRTGTLGFIDEEGYFTPNDRKSRFYIRSTGHKVYLDNVQNTIGAIDSRIADVAVVKVPDNDELFVNKAYVVLSDGIEPSEQIKDEIYNKLINSDLLDIKISKLKEYEIPRDIEFVNKLPRKAGTEKIDYTLLEQRALETVDETIKLNKIR